MTLIRLAALWRGTKNKVHIKGINLYNLPCYGKGKSYSKDEADRIMRSLICEKIIQEVSEVNFSGHSANYVKLGPNAKACRRATCIFMLHFVMARFQAKMQHYIAENLTKIK